MKGVVLLATCQKVLKAFLSNHTSCQLVSCANCFSSWRNLPGKLVKKRHTTISHSQDLRCYTQTNKQIHTENTRMKYNRYQTTALLLGIFLLWFGVAYTLQLVSYGRETASKESLLLGLFFTYSWYATYSQATPRLLNTSITGCNEIASNQL